MMVDIYCKEKKCPICEREITQINYENVHLNLSCFCTNGCYNFHKYDEYECKGCTFSIFSSYTTIRYNSLSSSKEITEVEERVKKEIEYWKKDYRYLAEILEKI